MKNGFTLMELLAVIVIMAIIVVVTVPTIINTIADARVNSLWNLAKATANTYDNLVAQDMIASEKVLEGANVGGAWKCLSEVEWEDDNGTSDTGDDVIKKLVDILDISEEDIITSGRSLQSVPVFRDDITNEELVETLTGDMCSSIRVINGKAELLLIANNSGNSKFAISGKVVYAFSSADKGVAKQ